MKYGLRRRRIFIALFSALILSFSCFALTACGAGDSNKISNDGGFIVEGGGFEKGCVLETTLLSADSEEYASAISAVKDSDYDKTKPVYVFDISVIKDGAKVQPNGKVKVTVPISEDVSGYEVLHILSDGKVESLSVTYKDGKATFETDSFSKFVFVKKISSSGGNTDGDGEQSGGTQGGGEQSGAQDNATKYTVSIYARSIVPKHLTEGGTVRDTNDNDVAYTQTKLAEGSSYTVKSHCYPNYYFVGWYEASEREEATEDTFISKEPTYTFTVNRDFDICAIYAEATDVIEIRLSASSAGFTYRNGKPITTLVVKDSENVPKYNAVYVSGLQANGVLKEYNTLSFSTRNFNDNVKVDDGGLDFSKVGTYTITYSNKNNENIKATLQVEVVEDGHTFKVSTNNDDKLKFRYNGGDTLNNIERVVPKGGLITLTAELKDEYAFVGWYDESDKLVSDNLVYCLEMPDSDVSLHGKYEASSVSLTFSVPYVQGELVDDFGNAYYWGGTKTKYFKSGADVSLTVREYDSYNFNGWYEDVGGKSVLHTTNKTLELTLTESKSFSAQFSEKIEYIEISSGTLEEEGFVDGKLSVAIGDSAVDYKNFTVKAKYVTGYSSYLSSDDYDIEGSVDFNAAGTYTVVYTYKYDSAFKTEIKIIVVDPSGSQFAFNAGYSYLDHKYDGKATFVSLKDVTVDGVPLYEFKSDSKIRSKISYKWIDKATNKEVDTDGADITVNGTVVKDFGPTNGKLTIGNEFGGPVKAGAYKFELMYDGKTVLTVDSTISAQAYKKVTSKSDFKTNEGSTWVNFELYYNTIVGYADGKYFVMQMPSIGYDNADNVEAEAREVTLDKDGNILLGDGNDFAFVNMRYYAGDSSEYTEFLTGYYGSYVIRSSSNTTDGTLFGSPYIYRTGYTCVSGGKIYREYGDKEYYGNVTEFGDNGAVKIYSRYYDQTADDSLRLVKDGDKYVFTSVSKTSDDRPSYDIFIYQSIITQQSQDSSAK